jgi:hypothetical protein
MQGIGIDLVAGARINLGDQRIVAGNDAIRMAGKPLDDFPALAHIADVVDNRKRAAAMQIAVVMRGIRRQHDRTARGLDPHHLQTIGMAADAMQRHAGGDLAIIGMELHAFAEDVADHQRHMLRRIWMAQAAEAHAAPGGEAHLAILQMKSRIRKQIEIAGMVVMQMGNDDIPDGVGTHTEARQCIHRIKRELAVSKSRFHRVEPGVDQNIAAMPADQPDEIIEVRSRGLVGIRREVIHMRRARRHRRITQRVDFVGVFHRMYFSWLRLTSPHQAIVIRKGQTRAVHAGYVENADRSPTIY